MPEFRHKPDVIEARQFDGTVESAAQIAEWSGGVAFIGADSCLYVRTPNGQVIVDPTDWVAHREGEDYYPINQHVLAAAYDPA